VSNTFQRTTDSDIRTQVLIVGGGPAGLSAAHQLRNTGISVTLVDENAELGGQYFRQRSEIVRETAGDFRKRGRTLVESVKDSAILILSSSFVFAVNDSEKIFYVYNEVTGGVVSIRCEFVIFATGSQELVLPYLGWETPKCITPGMASRIFDIDHISPDQSIVIGGSGPFLLSVAAHLVERGVKVLAVLEYHDPYRFRLSSALVVFFPTRLFEYLNYRLQLRRAKVPIHTNVQISDVAFNNDRLESKFKSRSSARELTYVSDYVAVSYGFIPTTEFASLVEIQLDESSHIRSTSTRFNGQTSKDWVYIVGESVNIQGWRAALVRGQIAAISILKSLKAVSLLQRLQYIRLLVAAKYEHLFTSIRARTFNEGEPFEFSTSDNLLVCRCENVIYREIALYLDHPWSTASGLKAESRVGMGTCQGKQCGYALGRICASLVGQSGETFTNPRTPLRPVPIKAIVKLPDQSKLAEH